MTELHYLSLSEICRRTKSGALSATSVVEHMLNRINTLEPRLKAFETILAEEAFAQAETLDKKKAAGAPLGLLHGAPIVLKDLLFTKGIRTTGGMRVHKDYEPTYDATVVSRLRDAGGIFLGKVKLTEGAYGEHHPDVEAPLNPWGKDLWTGVSSSGSGVSVAAGMAHGAIGTDTGGSIRFPSACCGIVGIKPTYSRVSRYGGFVLADSLDHFGPMVRCVEDGARMLQVMAGYDPNDVTSSREPVPSYWSNLSSDLAGVRIGVDRAYLESGIDSEVISNVDQVLQRCAELGCEIVEVVVPDRQDLVNRWVVTCGVECALAHSHTYPSRQKDYGESLSQLISFGRERATAMEYASLEQQRLQFRVGMETVLSSVDAVITPVMPIALPTLGWIDADPRQRDGAPLLSFTAPFDYSGHPTITLPSASGKDGLPNSFQLVGRLFGEKRLIEIAREIEKDSGFRRPPE